MSTPMQPCTYITPPQYMHSHAPPPPPTHPFYPGGGPPNFMVGCYQTNGWTGIPLISTAQRRPRRGVPISLSRTQSLGRFDEQSISRMAIHAHGAPLISIGGRYANNNNRKHVKKDALRTLSLNEERSTYMMKHEGNTTGDCLPGSGLDENSQSGVNNGGNNVGANETCLPRIIKPRKRRKKDRKPNVQTNGDGGTPSSVSRENEPTLTNDSMIEGTSNAMNSPSDVTSCSCNCNLCDPLGRSWPITPLRRSCSDNSSDVVDEHRRTKDVGVIGGDRRTTNQRNEWRSLPVILPNINSNKDTRKSSLSDSGDSGCAADILSGLNITDDLLAVGRELFTSTCDTNSEFQLSASATNNNINNNHLNYGYNKYQQRNNNNNTDTVLNEKHIELNLNELTRKLSETLDLKSDEGQSSSDSVSVLSDSVFSDGVPDLFVNFDSISKNQLFSASNISQLSNLLFVDDNLTSPALVQIAPPSAINRQQSENTLTIFNNNNNLMNNNNNNNNNKNCINKNMNNDPRLVNQRYDQPFIFIPDKDRSSEIFKCFDMVWNGIQQN